MNFLNTRVVAVGEAMLEMAPVGDGLFRRGFAGDTFNTVWHMAQLLGTTATVGYVTRVGIDTLSDGFVQELAADGLDIKGISRDPARTMGLYLIELDGVERRFHYWRENAAARRLADDRDVLAQAVHGAGLIHLSGITLAILSASARATLFDVLATARAAGAVISFDPNIRARLWASADEIRATITQMLALTDIALPSFDDETTHFGDETPADTIARIRAAGVAEVVVKDGAGPVWFHEAGQTGSLNTPPVGSIRDTTGAGDAFNAGYLAGRAVGRPPAQAIAWGQHMSARVLRTFGARAGKDDLHDLRTLLLPT
jgi:2-dehydro-3-deoxygluconokinase